MHSHVQIHTSMVQMKRDNYTQDLIEGAAKHGKSQIEGPETYSNCMRPILNNKTCAVFCGQQFSK